MSERETLKKIALLALNSLFYSSYEENGHELKIRVSRVDNELPNIFSITIGEPDEDSGEADSIYLTALVEVKQTGNDELDCRIVQHYLANDPDENTLTNELSRENFLRKLRNLKPPDEPPTD